jgi:monoamine oxidase
VNWANYGRYLKKPVLLAFLNADFARQMEALPEATMVQEAMRVLRQMYGPRIPDPIVHVRSSWISDPHSQGIYSYPLPGALPNDLDTLFTPVGKTLYFAGDGTTSLFINNSRGAYLTGRAAAALIIASGKN